MARDRQRAKQRRRKRSASPSPGGAAARAEQEELADEIGLEAGAPPQDLGVGAPDDIGDELGLDDESEVSIGDDELAAEAEAAAPEEDVVGGEGVDELEAELEQTHRSRGGRGVSVRTTAQPGSELPKGGNRFINFLRASVAELRRVQWPDRRQVGQATAVVLGFVVIAGGYLGLMDALFSRLVNAIL